MSLNSKISCSSPYFSSPILFLHLFWVYSTRFFFRKYAYLFRNLFCSVNRLCYFVTAYGDPFLSLSGSVSLSNKGHGRERQKKWKWKQQQHSTVLFSLLTPSSHSLTFSLSTFYVAGALCWGRVGWVVCIYSIFDSFLSCSFTSLSLSFLPTPIPSLGSLPSPSIQCPFSISRSLSFAAFFLFSPFTRIIYRFESELFLISIHFLPFYHQPNLACV